MDIPSNVAFPFFAYGLFKPGQLGFQRIREFLNTHRAASVKGELRERDGLPLLKTPGHYEIEGSLLWFRADSEKDAYARIVAIEPDKQYRWEVVTVTCGTEAYEANVLLGKKLDRGSVPLEEPRWDGSQDPLFTSAMDVVKDTLDANSRFEWDLKPTFRLQMAYLLLWSAIERYAALTYHLGSNAVEKVLQIADDPIFLKALKANVLAERVLYRADKPEESPRKLDATNPHKSLLYFYQVRNNITHRGKAAPRDHDTVQRSLAELYNIFRAVLKDAFTAGDG